MFNNINQNYLWNHNLTNEVINISFDDNKQFSVSINSQVLKLASRFANQCSQNIVSCILIGCCNYQSHNKFEIIIDRVECNLASYLSDNQLICSDDVSIPLKCFKSKSDLIYSEDDYELSIKEILKNLEEDSLPLSISKVISLRIYAGFNDSKLHCPNFNWIKLKLIYPDLHLTLSPINKILVFRSALVSSLEDQLYSTNDVNFNYGYLTMDHSNKLHFLLYSDDRVLTSPLVGVWVHGGSQESDLLVFVTCMKFILLKKSLNRICKPPFPFLLVRFTGNKNEPLKYYDIKWPTGPSEEQDPVLKFISFKLQSGNDDLNRYFISNQDQKINSFVIKLTLANANDKALAALLKAFKQYISEHCSNLLNNDFIPRQIKSHQQVNFNNFTGLEVPDVSLLINDTSSISSLNNFKDNLHNDENIIYNNMESKISPANLISKITVHSKEETDEATPRHFLPQQHVISKTYNISDKEKLFQRCYPQMQYFPQQIYPYPTILPQPSNPYLIYPANMFITKNDPSPPFFTKPPQPPKHTEKSKNPSKSTASKSDNIAQTIKKSTSKTATVTGNKTKSKVDKSVIVDVTNKTQQLPKRVLQLDREEDLVTLENLVQQIINQRHQNKCTMMSIGTNTSVVMPEKKLKFVEVSTDLPSFIEMNLCEHCKKASGKQSVNESKVSNDLNGERNDTVNDNYNEETTQKNSDTLSGLELENNQTLNEESENSSDESKNFDELLKNLESFVDQARNKSFHQIENENPGDEIDVIEESKINYLEKAVHNLRELDIEKDFETQYWETLKSAEPQVSNEQVNGNNRQPLSDKCCLDATILQHKINYVSLFLNNSFSVSTLNSTDVSHGKSSISEQSAFIEELALKYLSKATSKLKKLQSLSTMSQAHFIADSSGVNTNPNNISIATKEYLRRHNLDTNSNANNQNKFNYFSSIRLPNGDSLPKNKILVSSTPAPHGQPFLDKCFIKKPNFNASDNSDWSYVRILDGLKQQPSILPVLNQDYSLEFWPHKDSNSRNGDLKKSIYSEEIINVLDVDKLKQLPKYL